MDRREGMWVQAKMLPRILMIGGNTMQSAILGRKKIIFQAPRGQRLPDFRFLIMVISEREEMGQPGTMIFFNMMYSRMPGVLFRIFLMIHMVQLLLVTVVQDLLGPAGFRVCLL